MFDVCAGYSCKSVSLGGGVSFLLLLDCFAVCGVFFFGLIVEFLCLT